MKKIILIVFFSMLLCSVSYGAMSGVSTSGNSSSSTTISALDKAISWMHDNGLTIYTTAATFKSTTGLRRDEAAKFFVGFAKIIGKTGYVKTDSQCSFSDISKSRSDLKSIVVESCKLGLFQGSKGMFAPQNQLTNEQAITVLIRLMTGNQSETGVKRRSDNYYAKANSLNLLSNVSMTSQKLIASRGNVAIIIYNGKNSKTGNTGGASTSNGGISTSNGGTSTSNGGISNSNGGIVLNNNGTISTDNWTSYTSTSVGVSFKYPSTFTIKEQAFGVIVSDNKTNGNSIVVGKDSTFAAWDEAGAVHNFAGYSCLAFDVGTYGFGYATKYNNMYYTFRATTNTSNSLLDAFMSTIKIN